jgi:hypothetical protein
VSKPIIYFEFSRVSQISDRFQHEINILELLFLLPSKTWLSHTRDRIFPWLIRQQCIIRKSACTELTVVVSGPAASCTSATQHTHWPHYLFCPTNNSSVTREGDTRKLTSLFLFVDVCYQSGLETTLNALCLVSDLFSNSRSLCLNTFRTDNTCSRKSPAADIQNVSGENWHNLQEHSLVKNKIAITINLTAGR